jgi:hypothetical protein
MLHIGQQNRNRIVFMLVSLFVAILSGSCAAVREPALPDRLESPAASQIGEPANLPLPSSMPLADYERLLYDWLMHQEYKTLDWAVDKGVRDTGPFVEGESYGTHPAVRIYYSPEVLAWLQDDRPGDIADGAIIVKEMYLPPAELYQELQNDPKYENDPAAYEAMLGQLVSAWTVMVRDSSGSKDGWFWAGPGAPGEGQTIAQAIEAQLDNYDHILYSSFGAPCLRCHSSAAGEFTFSALANIEGFLPDEDPLRFRVDNSWRSADHLSHYPLSLLADDPYAQTLFELPASQRPWPGETEPEFLAALQQHLRVDAAATTAATTEPLPGPKPEFAETFGAISGVPRSQVRAFPMQWADHVVPGPAGPELYLTSDNCLGCHGGLGGAPSGVTMFVVTGPNYGDGFNVSEYGEWRWSPMGLAGRDPIFHAQLESELAILEQNGQVPGLLVGSVADNQQAVTNTCLSCHGAMGQRQLEIDAAQDSSLDPNFRPEYFYLTAPLSAGDPPPANEAYHKYGELAREGISCTVCHHIDAPDPAAVQAWDPAEPGWITGQTPKELAYLLFHNSTGRYEPGPADELFGPFEQVAEVPMENALGITPGPNPFTTDSQMCGTCHTINLPNIGQTENRFPVLTDAEQNPALQPYFHSVEQATFLEWQNSAFAAAGDSFRSCQDCHMPGSFQTLDGQIDIDQLVTEIATIQDTTYPQAEHEAPAADIDIPLRSDYKRHEHVGLNVFLLEMFNQFPDILGVDKMDYMTSATTGNALAIENMVRQAQTETISLTAKVESFQDNVLTANVTVTNKTGHRFPSGVAFRRAFLEFLVLDGEEIIWSSGRTNSVGIVDGDGRPLPTEFLPNQNTFQHHYQTITAQDQVQIYEELNQNVDREFTTSFIHRVYGIKDNRLLPRGWRAASFFEDQGEVIFEFMEATDPEGDYVRGNADQNIPPDPDYADRGPDFPGQDQLQYVITLPDGLDGANLSVKVTMNYQAIPPYWLHQRFSLAPNGEATRRLYYLASHLNLAGTAIENWKLPLVTATANVQ